MTCAEVIQLAQAQHEKMTQKEGNMKLPVKSELSWPADSSVLTSIQFVWTAAIQT